jgi:hypothetical protein
MREFDKPGGITYPFVLKINQPTTTQAWYLNIFKLYPLWRQVKPRQTKGRRGHSAAPSGCAQCRRICQSQDSSAQLIGGFARKAACRQLTAYSLPSPGEAWAYSR